MTEPANQPIEEQEPGLSSPADISSAARSCGVILVVLLVILLLLCVAFGISKIA